MIDAPRWSSALADLIEAMGGVRHIFLTHRDDVADHDRYAQRFGAAAAQRGPRRAGSELVVEEWIHEDDEDAAPGARTFREETELARGLRLIPVPGHTRGSAMLLADDTWLFTGDSLEWNAATQDLAAFEDFTWYSWDEQKRSLARLAETARFRWVLPGHGGWGEAPDMDARLRALVARM